MLLLGPQTNCDSKSSQTDFLVRPLSHVCPLLVARFPALLDFGFEFYFCKNKTRYDKAIRGRSQ